MKKAKQKLKKWLKNHNLALLPAKLDQYCPHTKSVSFNKRQKLEKQVYSILHECGHHIIQESEDYEEKYKIQANGLFDGRKQKSLRWRIDLLREEFDCWDKGKVLAKELKIKIDEKKYDIHAAECLKTYCHWVLEPKDYEI